MTEYENFHAVEWFIDHDMVWGKLTCTAPVGANCRLVCAHGCEYPCDHDLADYGRCCAVEWIETDYLPEFYGGKDQRPLRDGPIEVKWSEDCWEWTYV